MLSFIFRFGWVVLLLLTETLQAQTRWERIAPTGTVAGADSLTQRLPKPYVSANYNYGSAQLPAPRVNAVTWSYPDGTLWVFGGAGLDERYNWGVFQDMWRYEPRTNSWRLLTGSRQVVAGLETGDQALPAARKEAASWVDKLGNLWLYGGRQLSDAKHLGDLWRYEPVLGRWTRMDGDNRFNQGPLVSLKSTKPASPGSRSACGAWTDAKGLLWLFGGISYQDSAAGSPVLYNDLWTYNPLVQRWSLVGEQASSNRLTQLMPIASSKAAQPATTPSARLSPACWYEAGQNKLWLYGGFGYDSTAGQIGGLSDMWQYDLLLNRWQRQSGTSQLNVTSNVASLRVATAGNTPGYRWSSMAWQDASGNLLLMGGHPSLSDNQTQLETVLWRFKPTTGQWQVSLLDQPLAITSAGYVFADNQGATRLFGGYEFDFSLSKTRPTNALWRLNP